MPRQRHVKEMLSLTQVRDDRRAKPKNVSVALKGWFCFSVLCACHWATASENLEFARIQSQDQQFTAVVFLPPFREWEVPSRVVLYGPGGKINEYSLFKGCPGTTYLLNDGRFIMAGHRGCYWPGYDGEPESKLIAVFDSDGKVLFSADLPDLLALAGPIKFQHVIDGGTYWYRSASIIDGEKPFLKVVLSDLNELHLALDSLVLTHVPVPTEELCGDAEKLRSRAEAYLLVNNPEGVSVLEEILERDPGDHEAAYLLAKHLRYERDHGKAIAVLLRLIEQHPLVFSDNHWPCNTIGDPFNFRCELIRTYLLDGKFEQAMAVIEEIRPFAKPHVYFELLEIETLLALERIEAANAVVDALLARERQNLGFESDVQRVLRIYEKNGLHDLADAIFTEAGGTALSDPYMLEERADQLIRRGQESAAVPLLEKLLEVGDRARAATSLGRIHSDNTGDIAMDLDHARHWFEIAAETPDESERRWSTAFDKLCKINLVTRREGRLDDAVKWCEMPSLENGFGTFWTGIVFLDPSFSGHSVSEGLRRLESAGPLATAWTAGGRFFRPEYDEDMYLWAVRTLEGYVATDHVCVQLYLGTLYAQADREGTAFNRDQGHELLAEAAAQGSTEAMLNLARSKQRMACDSECRSEVRQLYGQAAALGEKWGYYYLAKIVLARGPDSELPTAERYLAAFSEISRKEGGEQPCRAYPRSSDGGYHTARELYARLEKRLGHEVTRVPDRGCP